MPKAQPLPEHGCSFSWNHQPLDRQRFLLLSWMLHKHDRQQEPERPSKNSREPAVHESDEELDSDRDTRIAQPLTHEARLVSLKQAFLNRLAEVMAPVKSARNRGGSLPPKSNDSDDWSHVAAAVLVEATENANVYVAKNHGLDKEDKSTLDTLSKWIRVMATTGCRPAMLTDPVWKRLLQFCAPRVRLYMCSIKEAFGEVRDLFETDQSTFTQDLISLYEMCSEDLSRASDAVNLAYKLRANHCLELLMCDKISNTKSQKLWKAICFLGRLRSAYETFKEAAMHFVSFKNLHSIPVEPPPPEKQQFELSFITKTLGRLGIAARDIRPGVTAQNLKILCENEACVHAEMQLLLHIKTRDAASADMTVFPYVGTSKKTCFLCAQILSQIGELGTRGSHGKVYPQWTVPEAFAGLQPRFLLKLEVALSALQRLMETRLKSRRGSRRYEAESSIGASTISSGSTSIHRLRRSAKTQQRIENARLEIATNGAPAPLFKSQILTTQAVRIPVDGQAPHLVQLGIYEVSEQYPCHDSCMHIVPDFQEYWHQCQYGRALLTFQVTRQAQVDLNGNYRVYWNLNPELGENQYLKSILAKSSTSRSSGLPSDRLFFHGDVFVLGIGKDERTGYDFNDLGWAIYRDVHADFLQSHLIETIFTHMWEGQELEFKAGQDVEMQWSSEEFERARQLVLQEMSEAEREMVQSHPGLLDAIVIAEGRTGDGWIPTGEISHPKDNPKMVKLHGYRKKTKLDRMGWQGFSSDQL